MFSSMTINSSKTITQFSVAVAGLALHIQAYTGIISMSLLIAVNLWSSSDIYKSLQLTFVHEDWGLFVCTQSVLQGIVMFSWTKSAKTDEISPFQ